MPQSLGHTRNFPEVYWAIFEQYQRQRHYYNIHKWSQDWLFCGRRLCWFVVIWRSKWPCMRLEQNRLHYPILWPIMWKSKLQTEISLSTMEAEYVALSMAMKEILPLQELIIEVCKNVGLTRKELTSIHSTVWEDNAGCVMLANLELPCLTPRSKHYAVKYRWFWWKLKPNNIRVEKIHGDFQLSNFFTKALHSDKFERLRKILMGW